MSYSLIISNRALIIVFTLLYSLVSCTRKSVPSVSTTESVPLPEYKLKVEDQAVHAAKKEEKIEDHAKNSLQQFLESGPRIEAGAVKTSADRIIESASKYVGVPYCMGGTTSKCIDCSGLIYTVFSEHGILLPHNSQEQSRYGNVIKQKNDLVRGDLVFFSGSTRPGYYITHSGIYTGDNRFIHASSSRGVIISSLNDPWWKNKFAFGTRILKE